MLIAVSFAFDLLPDRLSNRREDLI